MTDAVPTRRSSASQANATSDPRGCHSRWLILSLVQTVAAPPALPARGPGSRFRPSDRAGPVRRDRRLPLEPEAPGVCRSITTGTCLLYTSDAADDLTRVDLGGRRIIQTKKQTTART